MSKMKRRWINTDYTSPDSLRAEDIPYDATRSVKAAIDGVGFNIIIQPIVGTGIQGLTGVAGIGYTGIAGLGVTGLQGAQGETGVQGMTGIEGLGTTGIEGLGTTGIQGDTGIQGLTGISPVSGRINFSADSSSVLPLGIIGDFTLPTRMMFNSWQLLGSPTGILGIDLVKTSFADYPNGTSMIGLTGLYILNGNKSSGNTASWSGATGASGDIISISVSDAMSISRLNLSLGFSYL